MHINSSDLTVLFADHTVASVKDKDFENAIYKARIFINDITNWLANNNLFLNSSKTVLMLSTQHKIQFPLPEISYRNSSL